MQPLPSLTFCLSVCRLKVRRHIELRKPKGRPCKSQEEVFLFKNVRFPPSLWARLEALVPVRQRSAVIREGLARELRWLERQIRKGEGNERDGG